MEKRDRNFLKCLSPRNMFLFVWLGRPSSISGTLQDRTTDVSTRGVYVSGVSGISPTLIPWCLFVPQERRTLRTRRISSSCSCRIWGNRCKDIVSSVNPVILNILVDDMDGHFLESYIHRSRLMLIILTRVQGWRRWHSYCHVTRKSYTTNQYKDKGVKKFL